MKNKLKHYRSINGFKQAELASMSGVNLRTIQKYESGEYKISNMTLQNCYALSQVLNCRMEDFMRNTIINKHGIEIDFDVAVNLMNDELREELHRELAPCADQEFFDAYAKAHEIKFGESWECGKENPVI